MSETLQQQARHISHEIRNQLSICDIYSEIIKKHLIKDNIQNQSISNALDCIQNALKLIGNNLTELKSLGNTICHICDSNKLIQSSIEMSKVYAQNKNINFDIESAENTKIYVDENKFQGCVINILKNAVEAIENRGIIKISASSDKDYLRIIISNNGKPIPEKLQKELFNDGFTTKQTGSGIGLHLCKKYLNEMNGDINLISSDKKSTQFEISVPILK